jgi:hypothetical protein
MAATSSPFTWPSYASAGFPADTFPYADPLQYLQSTFWALPTASYGRWNGTGVTQGLGYPFGVNPGPPGGYGLFGGGGAAGGGTGGGYTPPTVQPKAAGVGVAAPSAWDNYSGSLWSGGSGTVPTSSLTQADLQYLNKMHMIPGMDQFLAQNLLAGNPTEIKNAIDSINATNPAANYQYDPSTYSGPLKAPIAQFLATNPNVVANAERMGMANPLTGLFSTQYLPGVFQNYFANNPTQAQQYATGGVRAIRR